MNVTKLIKELEKIKEENGPRTKISVNCREMLDSCNGVFGIVEAGSVGLQVINICDGDGFQVFNKDGSERLHQQAVISL